MFTFGVRFSRYSVSSALLMLGLVPVKSFAASCNSITCLVSTEFHLLVDDGSTLNVGTGGTVIDSSVQSGFIRLWDSSQSLRTNILGKGWLELDDNASAHDSLLDSGQMVVVGSASANGTTVNNGYLDVAQNATARDTRLNGGAMFVYDNAQASHTVVSNARMNVYEDAHAKDTTVNAGGVLSVNDRASINATVVNDHGVLQIDAGTTVHDTLVNQGGIMALGDQAESSSTTLYSGARLFLKGDATLGFASHIDGQVNFADPAVNGFHTLTIKGPLSGNGTFAMHTDLAENQGDLLRVQGDISGNHTLVVADSGKAPTNAWALTLVDGNGGSGDFKLQGGTVDAGAFRYELQHIGEDWYLINTNESAFVNLPDETLQPIAPPERAIPSVPETSLPPVFPVGPADQALPQRSRAQSLSKGANTALAGQVASATLISAQMTATTGHFNDLRSRRDQGGIWTRGYGTEQHLDTGSSRAFRQQANGVEIGADQALAVRDGTLYVGGLIGQGQARQDFGEASSGTIDSLTLGGYASYQRHSGLYVDGTLKFSRLDHNIKITSNLGQQVKAHYQNHALSADLQVGQRIALNQSWFVEPQAGLQVTQIGAGRYSASNGLQVEQDAMLSVQSRLTGVLGQDIQMGHGIALTPYVKAGWITEHAGDSHVKVSGVRLDNRLPGSRGEIVGGIKVSAADKHNLFVEGSYTKGNGIEQPWTVAAGYRYNW